MPHESATLLVGATRYPLDPATPVIVPAGPIVVEVEGLSGRDAVRLDGRRIAVGYDPDTRRATFGLDLKRATGYHELLAGATRSYLFGTDDAKLRISGVIALLDYLGREGLAWSGTMFFSGSDEVLRDHRLDRAWLERRAEQILELLGQIAERPATLHGMRRRRATHGVPDIAATHRLLRAKRDLLEEFERGPIGLIGAEGTQKHYAPREIVIRERTRVQDTPGNRRATSLLVGAASLARSIARATPDDLRPAVEAVAQEAERFLLHEPFRSLHKTAAHHRLASAPGREERYDNRYIRIAELHDEIFRDRHWDPTRDVMPERAYAGFADQIYQRFCAFVLADHLELIPAESGLVGDGPHFTGDRFELFVDVTPPPAVISDWRDKTDRPAQLRPDLVLRERSSGRVALLDAKYRNSGLRASSDSLSDVQLYLQAYMRKRIGILYPPGLGPVAERWSIHRVTDGDRAIVEVPILPEARLAEFLEDAVDPVIEELLA